MKIDIHFAQIRILKHLLIESKEHREIIYELMSQGKEDYFLEVSGNVAETPYINQYEVPYGNSEYTINIIDDDPFTLKELEERANELKNHVLLADDEPPEGFVVMRNAGINESQRSIIAKRIDHPPVRFPRDEVAQSIPRDLILNSLEEGKVDVFDWMWCLPDGSIMVGRYELCRDYKHRREFYDAAIEIGDVDSLFAEEYEPF